MAMFVLPNVWGQKTTYSPGQLFGAWEVVKMKVQNESVLEADREFVPPKKMVYLFGKEDRCTIDVTHKQTGQRTTVPKFWELYPDDNSIEFFDQKPVKNKINSGPYKIIDLEKNSFRMHCCIDGKCFIYWLERRPN